MRSVKTVVDITKRSVSSCLQEMPMRNFGRCSDIKSKNLTHLCEDAPEWQWDGVVDNTLGERGRDGGCTLER